MRFGGKFAKPKGVANNRPIPKRNYKPVSIGTLDDLINLKGYVHSNLDNFNKSYKELDFDTPMTYIKNMKQTLIKNNRKACNLLQEARENMEGRYPEINARALKDDICGNNEAFSDLNTKIHQLFQEKNTATGKREWTAQKTNDLVKLLKKIIDFVNNANFDEVATTSYGSVKTKLENAKNELIKILGQPGGSFDQAAFDRLKTEKQTYGKYIVFQILQALGIGLEPMIAKAIAPLFKNADVTALGGFQKLEDVVIDFNTNIKNDIFGLNIKSSATEYINATESHKINPQTFWGSEYETNYLPAASLLDYAFWNMVSLRQYSVVNQTGLTIPDVKDNQKEFLIDVMSVYQLVYLYSVMVTHSLGDPKNLKIGEQYNPKIFTEPTPDAIRSYYIVLKNRVFNTDDVYDAMIKLYQGTNGENTKKLWANAQKWIQATTPAQSKLENLHRAKQRGIQAYFAGKSGYHTNLKSKKVVKRYITYATIRNFPEVAAIIEEIYKSWSLSKNSYYVKYKVNIDGLLNIKQPKIK